MLGEVDMFLLLFFLSSYHVARLQFAVVNYKKWMLGISCAETIANMRSRLCVSATQII